MSADLLPCPFCGGGGADAQLEDDGYAQIICVCTANGPLRKGEGEAIAAWNTRTDDNSTLGWQDISTFPRDGECYLVCHADYAYGIQEVVFWNDENPDYPFSGESVNFHPSRFTHWRTLPEPPNK